MLETGGFQRHIYSILQPAYSRRYHQVLRAVHEKLAPLGVFVAQSESEVVGGYFMWLTLPHPLRGAVLVQRAEDEENVIVTAVSIDYGRNRVMKIMSADLGLGRSF